jgi:uncharacterized protein YbjT (DUF2867 family)
VAFAVAQHRQAGKLGAQVFATGTGPAGGRLDGITAALTGPEALGFADIAAIASELTGRRITRVTISDDEWKERLIAQGMPEQFASFALEIFTASRRGGFAAVDPVLKQLLGREPTHFRDVLAATLPR